jgi:hypothetical protein
MGEELSREQIVENFPDWRRSSAGFSFSRRKKGARSAG